MKLKRIASLAVAGWLAALPAAAQQQPAAPARRPTLVVLITVDQLRPDYFTRWPGQLTGGLARLYDGGAVFTRAYQDHAITETAPGHASTLSGRFPRSTGIVQNIAGVGDPQAPLLAGSTMAGASPFRFRGSTLTDWLRFKDPRTRALSVSRKDRGAILPLGRAQQDVYWWGYNGAFTTSTYYADTLPTWVQRYNASRPARRFAGKAWTPLLPAASYTEPDSVRAENGGREYTFPHVLSADPDTAGRTIVEFPWMDELTMEFALAGLRELKLGQGPQTDVFAVSFSTTDAVGHRYGQDSREIHDQVVRLDRMLGVFLDSLYAGRDPASVVIALTADHGVAPIPEVRHPGDAARYHANLGAFTRWLGAEARRMGVDSAAFNFDDGMVAYDPDAFFRAGRDPAALLPEAMTRFVAWARRQPGVMHASLVKDLPRDSATNPVTRRWMHMLPPDLPVAAVVTLLPEHVWGIATYGQHGTPHDYDAHVPVIFYGSTIRPGKYARFARVVDIAPTLARIVGVRPTEALDGRVLVEALR
ncbi:MAG TPA: alkaline phosphatase family protein [Longimicrobium sp.]|jgi:arylsulfatase A-like enzyme